MRHPSGLNGVSSFDLAEAASIRHLARVLEALLQVVLPVFAVAGAGFLYAARRPFPVEHVTDLIIHLTGACLVFDALSSADRFGLDTLRVPVSAALVMLGCAAAAAALRAVVPALQSLPVGAVLLPVGFMNAGNLGLPLAELAFGQAGLEVATLVFVTMAFLMYSVGVGFIAGRGGVWVAVRLPLIHAAWLGILVNQSGIRVPAPVATPIGLLGRTVVPLMLLALGARLYELVVSQRPKVLPWTPITLIVILRFAGGFIAAGVVNEVLGNHGVEASVILLMALLPPAVMNFALVEKYGNSARASSVVAGAIAVGTALAVVVLPLGLAYIQR